MRRALGLGRVARTTALIATALAWKAGASAQPSSPDAPAAEPAAPTPIGLSASLNNSLVLRGDGQQSTLLMVLGGAYAWNDWLSTFARVGWVHDAQVGQPAATGLANPSAGVNLQLQVGKHVTLGATAGATAPVGSGGGNAPNPALLRAWVSSIDWGGSMFAVDHADVFGGLRAAYARGNATLQLESTFHQLTRVRGAVADPIGASASVTGSQATVSYAVLPRLTLSTALAETRFWNTPKAIRESPDSRTDYFVVAGGSMNLELGGVAFMPGLVYARALDLPLSRDKFQVVELDLAFSM